MIHDRNGRGAWMAVQIQTSGEVFCHPE